MLRQGRFLGDLRHPLMERRQSRHGTGRKTVPVVLGSRHELAQAANTGFELVGYRFGQGLLIEPVGRTHHRQRRMAVGCRSHQVKSLAHQCGSRILGSDYQFPDPRCQTQQIMPHRTGIRQAIGAKRVEHAQRRPPQGTRSR
ncbi:MAG: hypothetical protein CVU74_03305 [Deltaproteobacteria bacterium HGW-Deltaproteobacteria-9]|nr:MAG: hypothetical protein CVU74_03305 [Deltaproteobacteria bacterium HGW-Deltaproteobacteria-9]